MNIYNIIAQMRSWLLERLEISAQEARDEEWWEVDAMLVLLFGSVLLGIASLVLK